MKKTWTRGILTAMLALTLVGCGKKAEMPVVIAEPVQTEAAKQEEAETTKPTQGKAEATKPTQAKAEAAKPTQGKTVSTMPTQEKAAATKPAQGKTEATTPAQSKTASTASTQSKAETAFPAKPTQARPTEPKATEPKATEPRVTEPEATEPKPTEPKPTEPKPTEPKPTEPKPTEPKPTEPKPTEPKPTEPKPTEPKPTEPVSSEPVHTHSYRKEAVAPTCTEKGYTLFTCTGCGSSYQGEEMSALGHSCETWTVTLQPTEEAEGEEAGTCTLCGANLTRAVAKLEHTHRWQEVQTVEATCYQPGCKVLRCACGEEQQEVTQDALGHDFHDDRVEPKTCTENGALYQVCSRCGIELKLVIPADHTWKMIPPEYHTRYYAVCPHCNVYLCELDGVADPNAALLAHIDATDGLFYNHSWCNEYEKTMVKPESFYCTVCGVTYQE